MSASTYSKHKDDVVIGRPPIHEERKKTHNITVTPTGWQGVQDVAEKLGCSSVSELVERIGRNELSINGKAEQSSESESEQNNDSINNLLVQNNKLLGEFLEEFKTFLELRKSSNAG